METRRRRRAAPAAVEPSPFLSVSETARLMGMSEMTLYRAINAGEFPAVRIRGRIIVPRRAIDSMAEAAMSSNGLVDAADWVPGGEESSAEVAAR